MPVFTAGIRDVTVLFKILQTLVPPPRQTRRKARSMKNKNKKKGAVLEVKSEVVQSRKSESTSETRHNDVLQFTQALVVDIGSISPIPLLTYQHCNTNSALNPCSSYYDVNEFFHTSVAAETVKFLLENQDVVVNIPMLAGSPIDTDCTASVTSDYSDDVDNIITIDDAFDADESSSESCYSPQDDDIQTPTVVKDSYFPLIPTIIITPPTDEDRLDEKCGMWTQFPTWCKYPESPWLLSPYFKTHAQLVAEQNYRFYLTSNEEPYPTEEAYQEISCFEDDSDDEEKSEEIEDSLTLSDTDVDDETLTPTQTPILSHVRIPDDQHEERVNVPRPISPKIWNWSGDDDEAEDEGTQEWSSPLTGAGKKRRLTTISEEDSDCESSSWESSSPTIRKPSASRAGFVFPTSPAATSATVTTFTSHKDWSALDDDDDDLEGFWPESWYSFSKTHDAKESEWELAEWELESVSSRPSLPPTTSRDWSSLNEDHDEDEISDLTPAERYSPVGSDRVSTCAS